MNEITTFSKDSKEYRRLEAAANLIQAETNKQCTVEDILFDANQGWAWTTISIESGLASFPSMQALNPKQQENIVYGDITTWFDTVNEVISTYK